MKKYKTIILEFILVCTFLVFLLIYGIYISYNVLTVSSYSLNVKKINEDINMVIISDLHENIIGENNEKLIMKIKEQSPQIILVVGDMINTYSTNSSLVVNLMKELSKEAQVFYSLGNSEEEYIKEGNCNFVKELEIAGVTFLHNKYEDIRINNTTIRIGGMYDYAFGLKNTQKSDLKGKKEVYDFLCDFEDTNNYKIMMAHRPDSFIFNNASSDWNIDLVVSGHTHGGQVRIPFLGGLYVGDQGWFPKYTKGICDLEKTKIIISSGLGSRKEKLPRFNNKPEIISILFR